VSTPHPLDFDALAKGMTIEQAQIEEIYQVRADQDPDRFRLAAMKLVDLIEKRRPDLYPRQERRVIRIMEDAEAEDYNRGRIGAHVAGIARDTVRRGRIDRSGFSEEARRAAESRDIGYSMLQLVARKQFQAAEKEAKLLGEPRKPDGSE